MLVLVANGRHLEVLFMGEMFLAVEDLATGKEESVCSDLTQR